MPTLSATPQRPHANTPLERLQQLLPDLFEPPQQHGELLLRFQLGPTLQAAISLERVVEVLQIQATSVTPIPNMPPATLGLMSAKGSVFWAVDLAQVLGLSVPRQRSRRYEVIVIQTFAQGKMRTTDMPLLLGLVVSRIRGTLRIDPEAIESAPADVPRELTPFLQGQIRQGEETLLLSVDAIASARSLFDHYSGS